MKTLLLLLLLISSSTSFARTLEEVKSTDFYHDTLSGTTEYFSSHGVYRPEEQIRRFLDSSIRVAINCPGFPSKDFETSVLQLFCYGAKESRYGWNYVAVNRPGTVVKLDFMPGPKTIEMFSVDYGWTGINHNSSYSNIKWAHTVAACLQQGKELPNGLRNSINKKAWIWMQGNFRIPSDLSLKRVDTHGFEELKRSWKENSGKKVKIKYRERTTDEVDSMLYYRVIIEIDRKFRHWPWRTWDKKLFQHLSGGRK